MKLNKLFHELQIIETKNTENIDDNQINIENIHYHSKKISKQSLFVCIKGYQTDGHKYIEQAVKNGAVAIIVEEFQAIDIPQYKVTNSRKALAQISATFFDNPSKDLIVIGVTATNGKTTTTLMIENILNSYNLKTGIIGTVYVKYDNVKIPSLLTTPESLDLQQHFYNMKKAGVTHVIMEVSSSALELSRTYMTDFNIVTFNNISREHIDNHGSFENYLKYKSSLITDAKENQIAILNLDDKWSKALIDTTKANVISYGIKDSSGDLSISDLDLETGFALFKANCQNETLDIELSVAGYHCVYNSLVAISVALSLDIPKQYIIEGLRLFTGIERRFELIYDHDFKIIDDHFANKGNIDITFETLNFMNFKKLHLVYAIRGSRGVTTNKENAEAMVYWLKKLGIDKIVATNSITNVMLKDTVTPDEEKIFMDTMKKNEIAVTLYDELETATAHVLHLVEDEDLILLAGCQGMDFGANIILNQIAKFSTIPKKELMKPLENRTAGILGEK